MFAGTGLDKDGCSQRFSRDSRRGVERLSLLQNSSFQPRLHEGNKILLHCALKMQTGLKGEKVYHLFWPGQLLHHCGDVPPPRQRGPGQRARVGGQEAQEEVRGPHRHRQRPRGLRRLQT